MELWLIPTFSGGAARDVIERSGGGHSREADTVGRRTRPGGGYGLEADTIGRRTRSGGGRGREAEGRGGAAVCCGLRLLLIR